ncbi:CTD small phosphatase-like protein [Rhynchospora pubera]|uniref:CTD small phosphatase-like protein n=1 Tax=Rhynchospora pubera TaxID=906938 RepID=A0AAV8HVZ3_9POAL|nr:CTD small phosphatase-like protein [Rhynchospora pubera]
MAVAAASEVCAPTVGSTRGKGVQAWKVVVGWMCFLLQVVLQILRGTPSWSQLLAYVGLRHPLLSSSATSAATSAAIPFVPLSTEEVPTDTPPPCQKESLDKLVVVLDLDETLVCAYETSSLPALLRSQAIESGIKCFELECTSSDKEADGKQKVNHVTVFERPGLHEFLQQTSEFADLILFTAGLEGYAKPLVDKIDLHKKFLSRLYRPSTVTTEYREHVKDLSCLAKDFSRIVIVDNNPFSFLLQPLNGIPCVPFSATQGGDNQVLYFHFSSTYLFRKTSDLYYMKHFTCQNGLKNMGFHLSIIRFCRFFVFFFPYFFKFYSSFGSASAYGLFQKADVHYFFQFLVPSTRLLKQTV